MLIDRQRQGGRPRRLKRLAEERGQAALEFILVMPLLILAVVIAVEIFQVFAGVSGALVEHRNIALTWAVERNDNHYELEPEVKDIPPVVRQVPVLAGLKGIFPGGITVSSAPGPYQIWAGTNRSEPKYP